MVRSRRAIASRRASSSDFLAPRLNGTCPQRPYRPPPGRRPVEDSFSEGALHPFADRVEVDSDGFERLRIVRSERVGVETGTDRIGGEADAGEFVAQRDVGGDEHAEKQVRGTDLIGAERPRLGLRGDDGGAGTVGESFEHRGHLRFRLYFW